MSCLSLALGLFAARAQAQSCHAPALRDSEGQAGTLRVSMTQLFAVFDDAAGSGDYQGLIPTLSFHKPWLDLELALPMYRLAEGEDEAVGPGDLFADVRLAVFRDASDSVAVGLELAASAPTGDEQRGLGMGHVMLMPGAFLRINRGRWLALAQLAYGRALGDGAHDHAEGHQHHGGSAPAGASPRVNPMNASELEHALGARFAVHPNLALTGRWLGAIALEDGGTSRQIVAPGFLLVAGALDASFEVQAPLLGDPFDVKLLVSIGGELGG